MLPKTPAFWYRPSSAPPSMCERLLYPLSVLYQVGRQLNALGTRTETVDISVICIGNLTAGGSGKTPACIAVQALLQKHNIMETPFFLTRGYGGKTRGPHRVDPGMDTTYSVGDEPLLLARHAPTVVAANRYEGACYADSAGADILIMDDGLQNQTLAKDISLLVIDGRMGLVNGKILPAGPLREAPKHAFERVDGVILIGEDQRQVAKSIPARLPLFGAKIVPDVRQDTPDAAVPYIAFCGLAYPDKFYDTLAQHGYHVVAWRSFPDHYPYTADNLNALRTLAQEKNAALVTTEKDILRLKPEDQKDINVLPISLQWEDEGAIVSFLKERLKQRAEKTTT